MAKTKAEKFVGNVEKSIKKAAKDYNKKAGKKVKDLDKAVVKQFKKTDSKKLGAGFVGGVVLFAAVIYTAGHVCGKRSADKDRYYS